MIVNYANPFEQAIVEAAVAHAKHDFIDVGGGTLETVDHSAFLAAAANECVYKLEEMNRAIEGSQEPPPGDDPEKQEAALRMGMFTEEDAMVEVLTSDEEEYSDEEQFTEPPPLPEVAVQEK